MTRQILRTYKDIGASLPKATPRFIADYSALKEDTDELTRQMAAVPDLFVLAGYGGIGVNAVANIGTIDSTFKTLTGFDVDLITNPRGVTYDKASNGIKLNEVGIWEFTVKVSLTFTELNAGREIQLRTYDFTDSTPGGIVFNYFVGRNQAGVNLQFTLAVEVEDDAVGNLIQLQVGSASDTFSLSDNIGTIYQAKHISEFKGTI